MIERHTARYYCPCYKSPIDLPQESLDPAATLLSEEKEAHLSLADPRVQYALFALEELYFCYDCHVHRCPRCVTEELVSLFCPNCLFEVPTRSNAADRHCPRNCFRCPECLTSLQTMGDEKTGYRLECSYCHWSSADVGLQLSQATGIVAQIHSQSPNLQDDRFKRVMRHMLNDQQASDEDSQMFRIYRQYQHAMGIREALKHEDHYKASFMDQAEDCSQLLLEKVSSKYLLHAHKMPLHTPLRARRIKRCRQCRLLLVKPDAKPLSLHFRSRLYARKVLPDISFLPQASSELVAGVTSHWILKVKNALPEKIDIMLSSQTKTERGDMIVIAAPELSIGPNSEEWEESGTRVTQSRSGELLEAGRNWAGIMINIAPSISRAPNEVPIVVAFAIFVQMQWEEEDERNDAEIKTKEGKTHKELGFWVALDTAMATRSSTT